ncbi:MAG: TonB-dependent receptor [Pseudomonadales bacterium]|nr:TonB-dependent receptor [Pseudomonadales bacterium]
MRYSYRSKVVCVTKSVLLSLILLAASPLAFGAGAADIIMEEVLVYGTKKSSAEAVQDTPAQVTAFGSDYLEAMQILNIEDLSFSTPNVQLESIGTQVSFAAFSIRGLGIDNSTPTIDPNVGTFIDGVYAGVPFGVVTDTFDLEGVEIYKGPQALLFGRNVTGGAVLLRSKRPSGEFGVEAKVALEEENTYVAAVAVQGSLIPEVLAGRLSMQYKDDDGWFENDFLNDDIGDQTSEFIRGSLLYTPTDDIELTFIFEDGHTEGHQTAVNNLYIPGGASNNFNNPLTPQNDDFKIEHDYVGLTELNWRQATFEAVIDFGARGQLTNIMAYREVDSLSETDVDGVNQQVPGTNGGTPLDIIGIYKIQQHQFSNELRYNMTPTDNWEFTTGLVYFVQEAAYGTGLWRGGAVGIDHPGNVFGGGTQKNDSWSFYFNNEYALTETLSLNGGFNYLLEDKEVRIVPRAASTLAAGTCTLDGYSCNWSEGLGGSDDWQTFAPKIGFTWQLLEDGQLYGHVARAYRSGFFNVRQTNPALINNQATDVEEHTSYELGIKSQFAEGRVRLNAAMFFQQIDDLARSAGGEFIQPGTGLSTPFQDLINVGDAEISGIELDIRGRIGDNLVISAALGYLDGDITDARANINSSSTDGNKDTVGDAIDESLSLVRLSEWSTNIGVVYDLHLPSLGAVTFRIDHNYRSEAAARDDNAVFFPATNMVNGGISYEPQDGNWVLSLYGKNLTDKVIYKSLFPLSNQNFAPVAKGRRYGLEFRYQL